jgi:SAM-dependent methyltransferase
MKQATFDLYLRKIRRFKSGGRILDIGCATGFFLERARAAGFDCYGVEVSGYSSAVARAALGQERIFTGVVETCPFAGASFDVITMFDLFEHVRDPLNTLCAAHRLLRDDGIVVIMTPDIESPTARLMGKTWTHFKPEHLFYFGPRSMLPAAAKTGFRIIHQAGAPKVITADYALSQFMAYPHRLITPFMKTMAAVLPERLMRKQLGVTMGERIFIMTKA